MKRVHVIITGDVQGMGFRAFIRRHAKKLKLTGWVKNRDDGAVEALFEGEGDGVKEMIEQCYTGPEVAWVDEVEVKDEPYVDEFIDFDIVE